MKILEIPDVSNEIVDWEGSLIIPKKEYYKRVCCSFYPKHNEPFKIISNMYSITKYMITYQGFLLTNSPYIVYTVPIEGQLYHDKENNIRYNSIVGLKEEYIAEIIINKEVKIDNKNRIRNLIYIKRKNTATNNIVDRANNGMINLRTFPKGWIKELNPYCIA